MNEGLSKRSLGWMITARNNLISRGGSKVAGAPEKFATICAGCRLAKTRRRIPNDTQHVNEYLIGHHERRQAKHRDLTVPATPRLAGSRDPLATIAIQSVSENG